ncbi:MAG: CDP-alcohol phosphatidyltransferase family protein [Actinomycetota bacterium]|nr:CDP-alcohol phosphatidyltransferase family protein [Actinomycetota bacterium]
MPPRGSDAGRYDSAILTLPNAISFARITLIPVFVTLLLDERTRGAGLALFAVVGASDWLDGYLARRTGQVSTIGKMLDPTADRLAIAAGLIALTIANAIPLWAVLLVVVRDALVLLAGAILLVSRGVRIDVRRIGKIATFTLMVAIVLIAWGRFDLPLGGVALVAGWIGFTVGLAESYVATIQYARDLRDAWGSGDSDTRPSAT